MRVFSAAARSGRRKAQKRRKNAGRAVGGACWYASRAEIESLYTVRGFIAGLRTLVTA